MMTEFDPVAKPKHYNVHPSGVEAIEICEHLNFNVGNAVKYLFRRGEKGAELEDLKKARWYVDREIGNRSEGSMIIVTNAPKFWETVGRVYAAEPAGAFREVLKFFLDWGHDEISWSEALAYIIGTIDAEIFELKKR